jgi:hypothetical protein
MDSVPDDDHDDRDHPTATNTAPPMIHLQEPCKAEGCETPCDKDFVYCAEHACQAATLSTGTGCDQAAEPGRQHCRRHLCKFPGCQDSCEGEFFFFFFF